MTTHDLHNEGALMGVGRAGNGVDRLDNAMQCGVRADGHVRAAEVVVNRPHLQPTNNGINMDSSGVERRGDLPGRRYAAHCTSPSAR